ncbi:hypothetical protein GOV09_05745 [Candidatus Woesearchaeota archaeon]|nr:hypothetical protein [Candidatus Woesearchaeota archaeon]
MLKDLKEQKEKRLGKVYLQEKSSLVKLDSLFSELSQKYGMDYQNVAQLLRRFQSYLTIPASLFKTRVSPLEAVVLFLHLKYKCTQTQMAEILHRDHTTIWTTLDNAWKKTTKAQFLQSIEESEILIPVHLLSNRRLSILEVVASYIKDKYSLKYREIATLLDRDDRTVWTVIDRARKKLIKNRR